MPLLVSESFERYTAPENLAYNEACLNRATQHLPVLRIFTFSQAGLILAHNESMWDIKDGYQSLATRRHTGGSVIYVDRDTLGYTAVFHKSDLQGNVTDIYKALTEPLVAGLRERGLHAELGRLFSIRVEGKVLAGHAQYNKKGTVQYDGILHLKKPAVYKIDQTIKLRVLADRGDSRVICIEGEAYDLRGNHLGQAKRFELRKVRDEKEEIAAMPGLADLGIRTLDYTDLLRKSFENVFRMESIDTKVEMGVEEEARKLVERKYTDREWVSGGTKRCLGHCFVDLVEPE